MSDDIWGVDKNRQKIVDVVEARMLARAAELKDQLHALVDKIVVRDFRVEGEHVTWSVHVPPTLLTLVHQLPEALSPHDD